MFVLTLLVCIWLAFVVPVRRQWDAVAVIIDHGGKVETTPSRVPGITWFVPGDGGNIEAVFFNRQPATAEKLKALQKLPHLRRLYLERTDLQPEHLDLIAALPKLRRLSLWGQGSHFSENADLGKLAALKNLDVLDIQGVHGDWRRLSPLKSLQGTEIKHDFRVFGYSILSSGKREWISSINSDDIDELFTNRTILNSTEKQITIEDVKVEQLRKLRMIFPALSKISVSGGPFSQSLFDELLRLNHESNLEIEFQVNEQTIGELWEKLGPVCDELEIPRDYRIQYQSDARAFLMRGKHGEGFRFQVAVRVTGPKIPATMFDGLPDLGGIKSFAMYDGTEGSDLARVAKNCPNVTHLTCYCDAFEPSRWKSFQQHMPNVERVTITGLDTYLYGDMSKLEKQCYECYPDLRELKVLSVFRGGG